MAGLLVTGTSSDAGKSLVVTALCRAFARRGIDVAPFKAQNMSNNSMVCRDGSEIGRAQYLQCQAAGVEASSVHNPVLLKPGSDRRAFVVVRGKPAGELAAGEYATGRSHLAEAAFAAYQELAATTDLVVSEGAGSPAEVNLRDGDYVNLGLARRFDLPVVLVGDIDRGGVLAALFGTWALLDRDDRALLKAFVINKFRGDPDVLAPGLATITDRTGMPCLGVLP
ncbi:MAG TPA: cobyric acid synthase, partial [Pedococcus sp.]|nr:cobyric acid synthase [Pedococcus sp.]